MKRYLSHGSALRHMAFVAPPPGAKHVNSLTAMANRKNLRAPRTQRDENPNARCVLRSDACGVNRIPSITALLDLHQHFFRPRHTPYLSHGSAVRHMAFVAPPPGAKHVNSLTAVANRKNLRAPRTQRDENPNARCVLRSDACGVNRIPSITALLDLHQHFFRPRHTPYKI
jgi:hypothetical protein